MNRRIGILLFGAGLFAASAYAQTTVTTSGGTANTIPLFTGSSTLGNSVISQSNGNVGIGTTSPGYMFDVNGAARVATALYFGNLDEPASITPTWGDNVHTGMTLNYVNDGTYYPGIALTYSGNVGIGTTSASQHVQVGNGTASETMSLFGSVGTPGSLIFRSNNNFGASLSLASVSAIDLGTVNQLFGGLTFSTANGAAAAERMRIDKSGNVGIGTTAPGAKLEVDGSVKLTSGSGGSVTFADGTVQSTAWTGAICGGDFAESIDVIGDRKHYQPGDVLVVDPSSPGSFLKSAQPYSTLVAGIYATKPGMVGRRFTDPKKLKDEIPMAMVGIVPTKVSAENGPIEAGDLLVTSSMLGYAMKGTDHARLTGAVVGKALGTLKTGIGVIEVLVSLQ